MSKVITNTIRHTGASSDALTLDSSGNTTAEGNLTVDGTSTFTGNVSVGTTSAGLKFHIQDGALSSAPTPNSNCDVVIEGTTNTGIQFLSSGQTQLRFGDADSTAAGAIIYEHSGDIFKLNYSNSGALTFNDGSGEVGRFTPDGLTFNGDTAAANTLDDYEEGTWTPDPSDGSVTVTQAHYTKIGRLVHIWCYINSFSDSSTNDQIKIAGLPFTPSAAGAIGTVMYSHSSDNLANHVYTSTSPLLYFYGNSNSTSSSYLQLRHNEITSDTHMYITGAYYV